MWIKQISWDTKHDHVKGMLELAEAVLQLQQGDPTKEVFVEYLDEETHGCGYTEVCYVSDVPITLDEAKQIWDAGDLWVVGWILAPGVTELCDALVRVNMAFEEEENGS